MERLINSNLSYETGERGLVVANVITGIRFVCAMNMIFCPTFSKWFYVLYIIGGISDILDGIVARHFGKETKFGARFDTISDTVFILIVIMKVVWAIDIPIWLFIWIVCIAVIKFINVFSGFVIYKQFVFEHTVMNKICGLILFAIPFCIGNFPWKSVEVLIVLACGVTTFTAVQEGYYIHIGKEIS